MSHILFILYIFFSHSIPFGLKLLFLLYTCFIGYNSVYVYATYFYIHHICILLICFLLFILFLFFNKILLLLGMNTLIIIIIITTRYYLHSYFKFLIKRFIMLSCHKLIELIFIPDG